MVSLTTEEEVERFLALDQPDLSATPFWEGDYNTTFLRQMSEVPSMAEQWAASKMKTRVVCFVYDKQEYKEELATVRAEARFLATRDNLRVGIVDNPRLVKKIKAGKYGHTLFPEVGLSALVLRRYDGVFRIHDLNGDSFVSPALWVNKQSLREVEELHSESYRIMELLRQPMFLAFIDFVDPRWSSASHSAVQVLREVAPKYSHVLGFFYVNNTAFWQRKRVLGVTWDELPAMAFNFQGDASRVMPYPRGREISKEAIFDFMDDLLTGRGGANGKANYEKYTVAKDFSKTRNDTEIETVYLKQTQLADRSTFASLVYSEGYDVLLLLYTTEVVHEGQRAVAVQYNLVADAFQRLLEA